MGALNITDQSCFAAPFGVDTLIITNANQTQTDTETAYTVINPNLFFVKKRVMASISIAGITLTNLAVLEDVAFPKLVAAGVPYPKITGFGPIGGIPWQYPCTWLSSTSTFANGGRCPFLPDQADYAGYNVASQAFRFGDTITVEGQTVSGITVRNITGIGMDPQLVESFKKIDFAGVVCDNTNLGFAVEKIQVEGIPVGPITVNEYLEFRFNPDTCSGSKANPFSSMTSLSFNTALGAVSATLTSTDITQQLFSGVSLTLSSGGLTIVQNLDSTLTPTTTSVTLATTLNPDSNPASLTLTANASRGTGLTSLVADLSVQRSGVTFESITTLSGSGTVTLGGLEFIVTATAGAVNLSADITTVPAWTGVFSAGINF